ncbi:MAG: DUF3365 domain-containing protein [Cyanobacteriota bacterium]|nr:DUF3365 domain-containing protein [Cyanobacteriota bacterium]
MKLQTRLELVILIIFICGWLTAGFTTYALEQQNARKEVVRNAQVLLNTAVASREYTTDEVAPLLEEVEKEEFIPQTVPSYAAQQLFNRLDKQYQDYNYVERAFNPTNPKDLAEGWQVELIQEFIKNPQLPEIVGERTSRAGNNFLYVAQPIQIKQQSCLQCHSTPEVAPPELIKTYGSSNGFGWKLNEIIGTRLISVPMYIPQKRANETVFTFLLLLASILLIAYTAVSLIVRRWVISPLDSIAKIVEELSLSKAGNSQLPEERADEIGKLSKSINRLLISLGKALSNRNITVSKTPNSEK